MIASKAINLYKCSECFTVIIDMYDRNSPVPVIKTVTALLRLDDISLKADLDLYRAFLRLDLAQLLIFKMNINITPIYVRFRWILQVYRFTGTTSSK